MFKCDRTQEKGGNVWAAYVGGATAQPDLLPFQRLVSLAKCEAERTQQCKLQK